VGAHAPTFAHEAVRWRRTCEVPRNTLRSQWGAEAQGGLGGLGVLSDGARIRCVCVFRWPARPLCRPLLAVRSSTPGTSSLGSHGTGIRRCTACREAACAVAAGLLLRGHSMSTPTISAQPQRMLALLLVAAMLFKEGRRCAPSRLSGLCYSFISAVRRGRWQC
jgi:hypothetical protein